MTGSLHDAIGPDTSQGVDALMARIAESFDALPRQLKCVASWIEANRSMVMVLRITDMSTACGVPAPTIVRFAQRFGFAGFAELQAVFRDEYTGANGITPSYRERIRRLIRDTPGMWPAAAAAREFIGAIRASVDELEASFDADRFEAAVALLESAGTIYVVGVRRSFAAASYLSYALQHTSKRVALVSGLGGMYRQQIRSAGKDDVVVAFGFAPYGDETRRCVETARRRGAGCLIITDSLFSPLVEYASASLFVKESSAFSFRSLTSTLCLCQALFFALACRLESGAPGSPEADYHDD
ncbi:MurR/RpiR family transcriptional regulator [Burkholderia anthina]|uniref:MurR/RpiR family transcriptional regulator n=1 Tax=Burkholderia anthina TaxID=179879 RepID=UPI0033426C94